MTKTTKDKGLCPDERVILLQHNFKYNLRWLYILCFRPFVAYWLANSMKIVKIDQQSLIANIPSHPLKVSSHHRLTLTNISFYNYAVRREKTRGSSGVLASCGHTYIVTCWLAIASCSLGCEWQLQKAIISICAGPGSRGWSAAYLLLSHLLLKCFRISTKREGCGAPIKASLLTARQMCVILRVMCSVLTLMDAIFSSDPILCRLAAGSSL